VGLPAGTSLWRISSFLFLFVFRPYISCS
jgi:hypothetical protein